MKSSYRIRIGWVLLIGALAWISVFHFQVATQKAFWLDESYELFYNCPESYLSLASHGAGHGQCSPNPLYYLLQKISVSTQLGDHVTSAIAWQYRLVSLISAALFFFFSVVFFAKEMSLGYAGLMLFALSQQTILHHYAAENRPYALWLCFSALAIYLTAYWARREKISGLPRFGLVGSLVGLVLTSGAGIFQSTALLFTLRIKNRITWLRFGTLLGLLGGITFYFGRQACLGHSAGEYDLLETGNYHLIIRVMGLLMPRPHDAITLVLDLLCLAGLGMPFLSRWKAQPTEMLRTARALHLQICLLLLVTLPIAVLVAIRHYYFVHRVFIFLSLYRAILIVLGAYFLLELIRQRWPDRLHSILRFQTAWMVALILVGVLSFERLKPKIFGGLIGRFSEPSSQESARLDCTQAQGAWYGYLPKDAPMQQRENFIVEFSRELARCGVQKNASVTGNALSQKTQDGTHHFVLMHKPPGPDYIPITQCGRQLPISAR